MSDKAVYRSIVLNTLKFARRKNNRIAELCSADWRRELARLTTVGLLRKFKFLITSCDDRTVGRMFLRGVFRNRWDFISTAAGVIIERGAGSFIVLKPLMDAYENGLGK